METEKKKFCIYIKQKNLFIYFNNHEYEAEIFVNINVRDHVKIRTN